MIVIEWVNRRGEQRRICLGSKEACGSLKSLNISPLSGDGGGVGVLINNKDFYPEAAILVDQGLNFGLVSKTPSELVFKSLKEERIVNLNDMIIEFKRSNERLSVSSLISILDSNKDETNGNICFCKE